MTAFPPADLPSPGQVLLITDELAAPADFLLHKILASHLKRGQPALVLSVTENPARWRAVASKSNVNFLSCTFVNITEIIQSDTTVPLRPIYDLVLSTITSSPQTLVILDELSTLEWSGCADILALTRFVRAISALCVKTEAALVVRHHLVPPIESPDTLLRQLIQISTYLAEVRPLASGRSGAVSGQVALLAGPAGALDRKQKVQLIPRSSAVQYRLTDTGAFFFDRGTGGAVL